jgi:hypothetical protein
LPLWTSLDKAEPAVFLTKAGDIFASRASSSDHLAKIITGAQPILPPGFSAYADMDR